MLKYIRSEKGLTLIEVIVVTVILTILATIAVPSVTAVISKTEEEVCKSNCKQFRKVL